MHARMHGLNSCTGWTRACMCRLPICMRALTEYVHARTDRIYACTHRPNMCMHADRIYAYMHRLNLCTHAQTEYKNARTYWTYSCSLILYMHARTEPQTEYIACTDWINHRCMHALDEYMHAQMDWNVHARTADSPKQDVWIQDTHVWRHRVRGQLRDQCGPLAICQGWREFGEIMVWESWYRQGVGR